tara:strand:+ start:2438 stop:2914 length:477 start_codon:yes stop_codon:yes gene_type:complete
MDKEQIDKLIEFAERTGFQFNDRQKIDIRRNSKKWGVRAKNEGQPDFKFHCLIELTKLYTESYDERLRQSSIVAGQARRLEVVSKKNIEMENEVKLSNNKLENAYKKIDDLKEDKRYLKERLRFMEKEKQELMMRIPKQSQTSTPLATSILAEANDAI